MKNIVERLKQTKMNNHVIDIQESKQPVFNSIHSLELIKLKTLKTYIKINLVSGFI